MILYEKTGSDDSVLPRRFWAITRNGSITKISEDEGKSWRCPSEAETSEMERRRNEFSRSRNPSAEVVK